MVSYSWDNKFDCNGKLIGQRMHGWQDAEMLLKLLITQWAKSPRKTVWRSAFFVNSALEIRCHIVKNTLLQSAFIHWDIYLNE